MRTVLHIVDTHREFVACLALLVSLSLACAAAEAPPAAPQDSKPVLRVALAWLESSEPLGLSTLRFSPEPKPFLKEPDFGHHRVVRGAFGCGVRTNEFIPFAWDQTANRLYLDRNGNQDLTDDVEAIYAGEYDGNFQLFPGVKLGWTTPTGSHAYLVDLRLGGTTAAQLQGTCVLRSFWQARVELGGQAYQIGLVENPNARIASDEVPYLLFRAWDARAEPIRLNPGTPHLIRWPERVYLAGRGFGLSHRYTSDAGSPGYWLQLTPTEPQLAELQVGGQHLYRLILDDPGGYSAILDQPGPAEKLPAGIYQSAEVWLRQGAAEAFYLGPLPLAVGAGASASLSIGGPLTNLVVAERSGKNLILKYRLVGAGNPALTYRMSNDNPSNPPAWTVLAGEKPIASGKFAYG